jgi:cell division protein FtsZ
MTLNLQIPEVADLRPKITVFGVGGAGCNAVNNMIDKNLDGVDFIVANTDAQALQSSKAGVRIQLGEKATEGLGAGAQPAVGAKAAEESIETIVDHLAGSHMCFITAGMGGGTGTGAAPIIAQAARELGILTVGVVTKPFQFEGFKRARQADDGVETLQAVVDTLIIIPNQNLFRIANEKTTFTEAFSLADDVLYQGVKGVTDLMVRPGIINLDFADIRVVMDEMGKAMMGTGEASGEDRAIQAAEQAINNPLLDEISLDGAKGVLINITGGGDLTLFEVDEAANRIRDKVDPNANILVGSALDETLDGLMRVSVVATGIDAAEKDADDTPVPRRTLKSPLPLKVEEIAEPAPEMESAPVMEAHAEPSPAPAPAMEAAPAPATPEPSFFDEPQAAPEPREYVEPAATYDDLPEPAYQAPVEPTFEAVAEAEPQYHATAQTGQPSAETMARLNAAVQKQPRQQPLRITPDQNRQEFVAEEEHAAERKGVLGGLISRMTGAVSAEPALREQPMVTQEPRYHAEYEEMEETDDQVEVPAFLRRQAN